MKLGESTPKGGRPPYILEAEDIELAEEMALTGLGATYIAKAFDVDNQTIYNLMERDSKFFEAIKKGTIKHYLMCDELANNGDMSPTQYIYYSRTKWKNFYPQEDKTPQIVQQLEGIRFINDTKASDAKTKE